MLSAQTTAPVSDSASSRLITLELPKEREAAGEDVPHAEDAPDLPDVDIGPAKSERRAARNHMEPAQAGEIRDHLVGDRVGE